MRVLWRLGGYRRPLVTYMGVLVAGALMQAAPGVKTTRLTRACITPLALAHPLLTPPYLSPAAAYTPPSRQSTRMEMGLPQ